jgi:hypothetical protein
MAMHPSAMPFPLCMYVPKKKKLSAGKIVYQMLGSTYKVHRPYVRVWKLNNLKTSSRYTWCVLWHNGKNKKNRSTLKIRNKSAIKKNSAEKILKKTSSSAASNEPPLVANQCGVQKAQQ